MWRYKILMIRCQLLFDARNLKIEDIAEPFYLVRNVVALERRTTDLAVKSARASLFLQSCEEPPAAHFY